MSAPFPPGMTMAESVTETMAQMTHSLDGSGLLRSIPNGEMNFTTLHHRDGFVVTLPAANPSAMAPLLGLIHLAADVHELRADTIEIANDVGYWVALRR